MKNSHFNRTPLYISSYMIFYSNIFESVRLVWLRATKKYHMTFQQCLFLNVLPIHSALNKMHSLWTAKAAQIPPLANRKCWAESTNYVTSRYNISYNVVFLDDVIFQYSPTHAVSKHKKSVRYCCQSLIFLRIQASNQKWEWNRDLADAQRITKVKPRQNILSIASSILFHPEESSFLVVKRTGKLLVRLLRPLNQPPKWCHDIRNSSSSSPENTVLLIHDIQVDSVA